MALHTREAPVRATWGDRHDGKTSNGDVVPLLGFRNVSHHGNRFRAYVDRDGKRFYLGMYASAEEAALVVARNAAAQEAEAAQEGAEDDAVDEAMTAEEAVSKAAAHRASNVYPALRADSAP